MRIKKQPTILNLKKTKQYYNPGEYPNGNQQNRQHPKNTLQQRSIIFGMLQRRKWVSTKNQTFLKIKKNRSQTVPDNY